MSDEERKSEAHDIDDQKDRLKDKLRESMIDSFDHLSQYDPDDHLIKSDRSISIIESFLSRDGKGKSKKLSETSEFSIISSPNI